MRVALLVRPDDGSSIAKFIEYCCCVWGGAFNPIIPVFERTPRIWATVRSKSSPARITAGYVRFFEPDVFVEAEPDIAAKAGIRHQNRHTLDPKVISLAGILDDRNQRDWSDLAIGLNIAEAYADIYKRERQFSVREPTAAVALSRRSSYLAHKAMFGDFPKSQKTKYIGESYSHVFSPSVLSAAPQLWRATYLDGAITPIRATIHELDIARYWYHTPKIFVFDPSSTHDVVDLWNMRLEGSPLIPVPFTLIDELLPDIRNIIGTNHRPLPGNPHGVLLHTTVELSRGLATRHRQSTTESLRTLDVEGYSLKDWREPIWKKPRARAPERQRLEIEAAEKWVTLQVREWNGKFSTEFEALSPSFADKHGGGRCRWINVIKPSDDHTDRIATCLPYSIDGADWPRLTRGFGTSTVSSEGWALSSHFLGISQSLELLTHEQAILGALKQADITAKPSEPGYIGQQIIAHLGGLWGAGLIRDLETIEMLNKMAMGFRRRESEDGTAEELFDRRSKRVKDWHDLVSRRNSGPFGRQVSLDAFTSRGVIRLGIQTTCPKCTYLNWSSIAAASYEMTCDRCQQTYDFPQAQLKPNNNNWAYRAVGPFAVPDYARGSYGTVLALSVLKNLTLSMDALTYSPGLLVELNDKSYELDFAALHARERLTTHDEPQWVFGETKSLGRGELLRSEDIEKLWTIASRFPGSCLVFSVMRQDFTPKEVTILKKLLRKCDVKQHSLLLLTANELFYDFSVSENWKRLGGRFTQHSEISEFLTLNRFARQTQALYLS